MGRLQENKVTQYQRLIEEERRIYMTIEKHYFYDFALGCAYFEWGSEEEGTSDINGGYLCNNPEQEEKTVLNVKFRDANNCPDDVIGECHCYSCPLGVQDEDDEEKIIIVLLGKENGI